MTVRVLQGNASEVLRTLPENSVHCCITSPPYWGLRSYGGDEGMIGLEPIFDEHLANLVAVFRELRRVLRNDGTVFLNYGDSYTSGNRATWRSGASENKGHCIQDDMPRPNTPYGLKPKDLIMMPARVAMALQADGWWLRSEIIWHKLNPMPESVKDRPTSAHEKMFLLSKAARYFYDAEAVRVAMQPQSIARLNQSTFDSQTGGPKDTKTGNRSHRKTLENLKANGGTSSNLRNVWTIATHSFKEAHFATFPPALVEPCIKAGTSARGVCGECGAPWAREVEKKFKPQREGDSRAHIPGKEMGQGWEGTPRGTTETSTTGWSPSCNHDAPTVPATVLDPFAGSGTTGLVADKLGRDAILIEINAEYADMARERIVSDSPLFVQVS